LFSAVGLSAKSSTLLELVEIFGANKFLLFFTPLTAGIVEELIFRGYLQPRMEIFLKKPYLAIIVSSLLFGLLHYKYGTLFNMVGPFFIGAVFAYHYWKFRNIGMLIICHFLWDLIAIMILVRSS
jgi:membrane protease YdiL (CAAX protease family)